MSTVDQTACEKPSRRRRALKIGLWIAGVLVTLVLLAVVALHTAFVQDIIRERIEARLGERINGKLTIESLEISIFDGLRVDGVRIEDATGHETARLSHVEAIPIWTSLFGKQPRVERFTVSGLVIHAYELPEGGTNLSTLFKPKESADPQSDAVFAIDALEIKDLEFHLQRLDGSALDITEVRFGGALDFNMTAAESHLAASDLELGFKLRTSKGREVDLDKLTFSFSTQGRLFAGDFEMLLNDLEAHGAARFPGRDSELPINFSLAEAHALISGAEAIEARVHDLSVGAVELDKLTVNARFAPGLLGLTGAQAVSIQGLAVRARYLNWLLGEELIASDIDINASIKGPADALVVNGEAVTPGGILVLSGGLDMSRIERPAYDLHLKGRRIQSEKLILKEEVPIIKGSFDLGVKGAGLREDDIDSTIELVLGPSQLGSMALDALELEAKLLRGDFEITKLIFTILGQKYEIVGNFAVPDRKMAARIQGSNSLDETLAQLQTLGMTAVPLEPGARLDVDLDVSATMRDPTTPVPERKGNRALLPPELAARLDGLDTAQLKGSVSTSDVQLEGASAQDVQVDVDLDVSSDNIEGNVEVNVQELLTQSLALDVLGANIAIAGQTITVKAHGSRGNELKLAVQAEGTLQEDGRTVHSQLQVLDATAKGLSVSLAEPAPVSVVLPTGLEFPRRTPITIGPLSLRVAGGTLTLLADVTLYRESLEASPVVERFDARIGLRRIRLHRVARALGARLPKGARASLSGALRVQGTLQSPTLTGSLNVALKAPDVPPLALSLTPRLSAGRFSLEGELRPRDSATPDPLLTLSARAPFRTQPKPKLDRSRLELSVHVPRLALASLSPWIPGGLPERLNEAYGQLDVSLSGRGPSGTFTALLEGPLLDLDEPGSIQSAVVEGTLEPGDGEPLLNLSAHIRAGSERLGGVTAAVAFDRNPLSRRAFKADWTLDIDLPALALERLRPGGKPLPVTGIASVNGRFSGTRSDALGSLTVDVRDVMARGKGPFAATFTTTLEDARAVLDGQVDVLDQAWLELDGELGLGGAGLLTSLRGLDVRSTPFSLALLIPQHMPSELAPLAPALEKADGVIKGQITASGTVGAPMLDGRVAWTGFERYVDGPGSVALTLTGDREQVRALVGAGSEDDPELTLELAVLRADVEALLAKERDDIGVTGALKAPDVDVKALLPKALASTTLDFDGRLDADVSGAATYTARGEKKGLSDWRIDGALALKEGELRFAEHTRNVHDLTLILRHEPGAIVLDALSAHETDPTGKVHRIEGSGRLGLSDFSPTDLALDLRTEDWLALGPFDAPKAEITAALEVRADLRPEIAPIDVAIRELDVYSPSRFRRMHYQETVGENDIVFVDAPSNVGKLPQPEVSSPRKLGSLNANIHVHTDTPQQAHYHPLKVEAEVDLMAEVREGDISIAGDAELRSGTIQIMGKLYTLQQGGVRFRDMCSKPPCLDLHFGRAPMPETQRDYSLASAGGTEILFNIIGPASGRILDIGGAAGPYLVDAMSLQNGGRPMYQSAPHQPASQTVQYPGTFTPQIFSFLRTNLPHLLFMDKLRSWSEGNGNRGQYGQIRNYEIERYVGEDRDGRVRVEAKPRQPGQNEGELQYDWLFVNKPRFLVGIGPRFGTQLRGGVELFFEWSSED